MSTVSSLNPRRNCPFPGSDTLAAMVHRTLAIALFFLASSVVAQPTVKPGTADSVDMSAAVLRAGARLYAAAVTRDDLRGAVILVARRGRIVLHEAYGWRDEKKSVPMAKDTLFRMASNTKPVIATAVLQLIEAGKLGLDDPVKKHIPSFDNEKSASITIRHLLTHTSGFRIDSLFLKPLMAKSEEHPDAPNLRLEAARFGGVGPVEKPGTSYSYSNPGFNTLGALIEIASGMSLERYLQERIYQPLGMTDSCNFEPRADNSRMSAVFRRKGDLWRVGWRPGGSPTVPFVRASGGMVSTAMDYAVFCQMFLNGGIYGGKRLLSEASVREATKAQTKHTHPEAVRNNPRQAFYGFGWRVTNGVHAHGGSDGTYGWVDPRRQIIGLVFTQSPGGANPRGQFQRVVDAACAGAR